MAATTVAIRSADLPYPAYQAFRLLRTDQRSRAEFSALTAARS